MGEHQGDGAHFVMVEEKRNILVGYGFRYFWIEGQITCSRRLGIFGGFAAFFMMEKTLRVLGGGEEGGHSHSHSHSAESSGHATGVSGSSTDGLRKRGVSEKSDVDEVVVTETATSKGPSKLSAYLNLFGDFVHNMYGRPLIALMFGTLTDTARMGSRWPRRSTRRR
jgi:solute carrier family 39 (zinc transporter), member 7